MKTELKFKPGDFITQSKSPQSFAIFGGDEYEESESGKGTDYTLFCYYNPSHFNQDSNGKWVRESVLEYDLDDTEECCFAINSEDFNYWRKCTDAEIETALSLLAEQKRLAWDDRKLKFRKLTANERFIPGKQPTNTGACGGNVRHTGVSPYYCGGARTQTPPRTTVSDKKLITRNVSATWEQKMPIETMSDERKSLIGELCDKLKYAFDRYNNIGLTRSTRMYPADDEYCGYDEDMMGMAAYRNLMRGDMWGCFD